MNFLQFFDSRRESSNSQQFQALNKILDNKKGSQKSYRIKVNKSGELASSNHGSPYIPQTYSTQAQQINKFSTLYPAVGDLSSGNTKKAPVSIGQMKKTLNGFFARSNRHTEPALPTDAISRRTMQVQIPGAQLASQSSSKIVFNIKEPNKGNPKNGQLIKRMNTQNSDNTRKDSLPPPMEDSTQVSPKSKEIPIYERRFTQPNEDSSSFRENLVAIRPKPHAALVKANSGGEKTLENDAPKPANSKVQIVFGRKESLFPHPSLKSLEEKVKKTSTIPTTTTISSAFSRSSTYNFTNAKPQVKNYVIDVDYHNDVESFSEEEADMSPVYLDSLPPQQTEIKWSGSSWTDVYAYLKFEKQLGAGSFAKVYLAHELVGKNKIGGEVAVKVMEKQKILEMKCRKMVEKEFSILSKLSHPHICKFHRLLEDKKRVVFYYE
jgi:hypothetical protein